MAEEILEETESVTPYYVDLDSAEEQGRSAAAMVAARRTYKVRQGDTEETKEAFNVQDYLDQIVQQCAGDPDYLPPDTPFKEAAFRVMLGGGNSPITAEEISEDLTKRWAMSPYPRETSPDVITKMLEHGKSYMIEAQTEPEE